MLEPTLEAAARTLAATLKASPKFAAFGQAQAELEADQPAKRLMADSQQLQQVLLQKQQSGALTQEEIDGYRRLQREIQSNVIIVAYVEAQRLARAFLPEVNQEISQVLGFDFSRLASTMSSGD